MMGFSSMPLLRRQAPMPAAVMKHGSFFVENSTVVLTVTRVEDGNNGPLTVI